MKPGDIVKAAPAVTGLDQWVEGTIIEVKNNPFLGTVIAIKDALNRIFFGEEKYFEPVNQETCSQ
jgi:hypothetical protein